MEGLFSTHISNRRARGAVLKVCTKKFGRETLGGRRNRQGEVHDETLKQMLKTV